MKLLKHQSFLYLSIIGKETPREITISTIINSPNRTIRRSYHNDNQTRRITPIKRNRFRKLVSNDAYFASNWNESSHNYCQQSVFPQSLLHTVIAFCEPQRIISFNNLDKTSSGNGEDSDVMTLLRSSKTTRFGGSSFSSTARQVFKLITNKCKNNRNIMLRMKN